MTKSLTQMAAEIIAARVRHEAMTSQQIAECLNGTFEALQKLKEKEDIIPESAVQPIIQSEEPPEAKQEEPEIPVIQNPIESKSPKKDTIRNTILNLIKSNPKGVDTKYIMKKTGLNENQVWATVNKAKKMGEIKTTKRGIYVSVKSRK